MYMGLDSSPATPDAASLAPGFRFHPTDEELVWYYLKRKVCGKPFRFDAISDVDVYKCEPWDLPGKSRLKSRDLNWYFFSVLDKKYGNGSKTNRATERGYWKTTGKDRPVMHRSRMVGMKKTLVYHSGRAPHGDRTNWVMHEYKLADKEFEKAGIVQDAVVLCRIFQKSGTGPKNGEQYGAPLIEEEWEDDELISVPGLETAEEVPVGEDDHLGDDAYLDEHDLKQIPNTENPSADACLPSNIHDDTADFVDETQKILVGFGESSYAPEQPDGLRLFDLPPQHDMDVKPVKHEYMGESSNFAYPMVADPLLEKPFLDAGDDFRFEDRSFLETNDLLHPAEAHPSGLDMIDDYLTYLNADEDYLQLLGSENLVSEQAFFSREFINEESKQDAITSQGLTKGQDGDVASSSKKDSRELGLINDIKYPFMKQASHMLGSIPAPPAFASEFPTKGAALQLNSVSPSTSSVHVTAGMIQIRNISMSINGSHWSFGKQADVSIILSLNVSQYHVNSASLGKAASAISWGWAYLVFVWLLMVSISFKIGTCI